MDEEQIKKLYDTLKSYKNDIRDIIIRKASEKPFREHIKKIKFIIGKNIK